MTMTKRHQRVATNIPCRACCVGQASAISTLRRHALSRTSRIVCLSIRRHLVTSHRIEQIRTAQVTSQSKQSNAPIFCVNGEKHREMPNASSKEEEGAKIEKTGLAIVEAAGPQGELLSYLPATQQKQLQDLLPQLSQTQKVIFTKTIAQFSHAAVVKPKQAARIFNAAIKATKKTPRTLADALEPKVSDPDVLTPFYNRLPLTAQANFRQYFGWGRHTGACHAHDQ